MFIRIDKYNCFFHVAAMQLYINIVLPSMSVEPLEFRYDSDISCYGAFKV